MIKAIIIEDEKPAGRHLQRMLEKEGLQTLEILPSVEVAVAWLRSNPQPQLVFADIQLSDGLSFDIFKQQPVSCPIIFTTAYDQYAIKAFKLNSIDYLLKPIKQDELQQAIYKYKKLNTTNSIDINNIIKQINKFKNNYKERFIIKAGIHIRIVEVDDIACFYSEEKTTYLRTLEGKEYITDESLEKIEKLINPTHFFMVNRKFIVALKSIKDIVRYSNSRYKLIVHKFEKTEIIVAREKVKIFKAWLGV